MTHAPPALVDRLRQRTFGIGRLPAGPATIGAEVEFIPVDAATGRVAPIEGDAPRSTMAALRRAAARHGWRERRSRKSGLPELATPAGGRITFEPGGQIEYASPPMVSVSALAEELRATVLAMRDELERDGIASLFTGIDPSNPVDDVPLQARADRYTRMDAHFSSIGPHGARMMRQSASIQVSIDPGKQPLARWELLNAISPFLSAMFANAPVYERRAQDVASVRQLAWRHLDRGRTGIPFDVRCPVEAYASFALDAAWILGPEPSPPFRPFRGHIDRNAVDLAAWDEHLTTLFPEVRPRGYFEMRGIDALDPSWYVVPLVTVAGLALDERVAADARALAGPPDPSLLWIAAREGLADPGLARVAGELARLALEGAAASGSSLASEADRDRAREFFRQFTWAGRAPADNEPAPIG